MLRNSVLSGELEGGGVGAGPSPSAEAEWYTQSGRAETPTTFYDAHSSQALGGGGQQDDDDDDDETPLLEELGVRPEQILAKLQCVLNPTKRIDKTLLDDADIAGPIIFCLCLGGVLLLTGKLNFGYIYGFSAVGSISLHLMLNLLHTTGVSIWMTASILGYSLLPVIVLATLGVALSMRGLLGVIFSIVAIGWSTGCAVRFLDAKLQLGDLYWLVLYPVALLYSTFTLISIF